MGEQEDFDENVRLVRLACAESTQCTGCRNGGGTFDDHECPYQVEINNDAVFRCNCCEHCTDRCAMDI